MVKLAAALRRWRADDLILPLLAPASSRVQTDVRARAATAVQRGGTPAADALPDALQLAVRLLAEPTVTDGRLFLFGAAGGTGSARRLLAETARALHALLRRPLLIVDLQEAGRDAHLLADWPFRDVSDVASALLAGEAAFDGSAPIGVARASAAGRDALTFLSSADFGPFVDLARRRFGAVLFHASPLPTAVGGMIAARHCDHVVLSVGEGVPLASVRRAVDQLRGVSAHVLGVVLEQQSRRRESGAKGARI